ncbi:pyrophosphate-energized vacuolar membrane proton pump 1-like [Quercus suber]|uniref:pyrophosphate-energized vacuolar membrane proton pump 1-like n=1 Tax=Quercus suber TaxID=58331 RepID=UPI000CE27B10|nr:pyrophosphate-energized vacuolar membrane proton pump 1-like [Quercus suber]
MATQTSLMGIMVYLITKLNEIKRGSESEPSLRGQLISTVLMTAGIAMAPFLLCAIGLWAGLVIGYTTEYYTSNAYSPVKEVADFCRIGAAINDWLWDTNLSLFPYLPLPFIDNAGGIVGMAGMSHEILQRADSLDAARNATAAIGKVIIFAF